MGADHVGPVEHDGHLGAEAPRQVVGGIEGAIPLAGEVEGRPAELGHVVPVDEDERAGHTQQMLGRRPRVVGDGTGKGDGASWRGRHGYESLQPVGERTSGRRERSHLVDAARPGTGRGAGGLGARREQGVALLLGLVGAATGIVALVLDGGEFGPRRLGTVVGVTDGDTSGGELVASRGGLGRGTVVRPAVLAELALELGDAVARHEQLGPRAHGRLLGRRPSALGAAQLRRRVVVGTCRVRRFHQRGDALLPAVVALQPFAPDVVDELGGDRAGEPLAEGRIGLHDPSHSAQRTGGQAAQPEELLQLRRMAERRTQPLAGLGDTDGELEGGAQVGVIGRSGQRLGRHRVTVGPAPDIRRR